ncbi:MAG: hypothetical protein AAGK97_18590, partial [Bacteroidota bacterium]
MLLDKHRSSIIGNRMNDEATLNSTLVNTHGSITADVFEIKQQLDIKTTQIDELNELLKAAHVTINKLNDRLSTLEEEVGRSRRHQDPSGNVTPGHLFDSNEEEEEDQGTLLLGDSNLCQVKASDLGRNCFIRTIKDADIELLRSWVNEKLQWKPSRCILVCGTQDFIEEKTASTILDSLGSLVADLKHKNENMDVMICQLGPTLKHLEFGEIIDYLNDQLDTWCNGNGLTFIKSELSFKLGTGEIDDACYDVAGRNSGMYLNRLGATRLLTTLAKQCDHFSLCENWEDIKRSIKPNLYSRNLERNSYNQRKE